MGKRIIINRVRLSFPHLFTPRAFGANDKPKYQASLLLPSDHPQLAELRETIQALAKEQWGKVPLGLKTCLRDGAEKEYEGYGPGVMYITTSTERRPKLYGRRREPLEERDGLLYAGAYVNASIDLYANEHRQGGKGVYAGLMGLQFVAHGDELGGARHARPEDFPEYEDDEDDFLGTAA